MMVVALLLIMMTVLRNSNADDVTYSFSLYVVKEIVVIPGFCPIIFVFVEIKVFQSRSYFHNNKFFRSRFPHVQEICCSSFGFLIAMILEAEKER